MQTSKETSLKLGIPALVALLQLLLTPCSIASSLSRASADKTALKYHERTMNMPKILALQNKDESVTPPQMLGKYEIFSVSGEPNYKSVDLTWEMQLAPTSASTNNVEQPPKIFEILICELQTFGLNRCRVKLVDEAQLVQTKSMTPNIRIYSIHIDNLRMATTYSFNIRPQEMTQANGRAAALLDNEIDKPDFGVGHSIIIPTKGFEAVATKCLPHASEIEVETGPYFAGKIIVDGGNCVINGNRTDPVKKYTMRIDHKMCGSLVKPLTKSVETFITVQENLGIFTHSTRRFLVICSFQSGMQTVRASFTVPGKKEVVTDWNHNDPFYSDDRIGREQQTLRYVDKSVLVLKDSDEVGGAETTEMKANSQNSAAILKTGTQRLQPINKVATAAEVGPFDAVKLNDIKSSDATSAELPVRPANLVKFSKLVLESAEDESAKSLYKYVSSSRDYGYNGSIIIAITLSVIILCLVYVVLQKTQKKQISRKSKSSLSMGQQHMEKKLSFALSL